MQKKYKAEEERWLKARKKREEKEKIAKKQAEKKAEEKRMAERRAEKKAADFLQVQHHLFVPTRKPLNLPPLLPISSILFLLQILENG